jgi:DNA-binding CsgD family transcriptional regulator
MTIPAETISSSPEMLDDPGMLETNLNPISALAGVGSVILSIFDQFSVGVVLLDRSARVLFANAAAQSLSDKGDALRVNAKLSDLSSEHARRLGDLVGSVLAGTSIRSTNLPAQGSRRPLMIMASPIQGTDLDRSKIRSLRTAVVMLLICDPDRKAAIPDSWMMEAYGLTLAEVRVAFIVATGTSISGAARRLKVSVNTVKTHLRHVYEKTGTNRLAELARLMATISLARDGGS